MNDVGLVALQTDAVSIYSLSTILIKIQLLDVGLVPVQDIWVVSGTCSVSAGR